MVLDCHDERRAGHRQGQKQGDGPQSGASRDTERNQVHEVEIYIYFFLLFFF